MLGWAVPRSGPDRRATAAHTQAVINEVAWMGTLADASDEWIELYNPTGVPIDLSGWTLQAMDGTPTIPLSGVIRPYGFFLLERSDDGTISDIPADQIYVGALGNAGETLVLRDASGTVVDTANGDGGAWPAGDAPQRRTMERIDPFAPDVDTNWATNDGITCNGRDAAGQRILGTPRLRNSASAPAADLAVEVEAPAEIQAGSEMVYGLQVGNTGNQEAARTVLTATLSAGVSFLSQEAPFPFRIVEPGLLVWEASVLPFTLTRFPITLTVQVAVTASGSLPLEVFAQSLTPEATPENNRARVETLVRPLYPDLVAAKAGPAFASQGETVVYTLSVRNEAAVEAPGVLLTDTLPAGLSLLEVRTSYTCTGVADGIGCFLGALAPGAEARVVLVAQVAPTATGALVDRLFVRGTCMESLFSNNLALWTTTVALSGEPHVLLEAVLYDGYESGDLDEAIRLVNIGEAPADLTGWQLCKYVASVPRCRDLPELILVPGARVWLARDGAGFSASFGFPPDLVLDRWLPYGLGNEGDEVALLKPDGETVDALVYGAQGETGIPGWVGPPLLPYQAAGLRLTGQVLQRLLDERTSLPVQDTDSAGDWMSYPGDPLRGRKVVYPGWDLDLFYRPLLAIEPASLTLAVAPDHAGDLLLRLLDRAEERVEGELYVLENYDLVQRLVARARSGVHVTLLLEGEVAGMARGISDQERWACWEIEAAGGACWFLFNEASEHIYDRYATLHSKMLLIDRRWLVLSTQNLTPGGLPTDDKTDGTWGSRGVVLVTDAPSVVERAAALFEADLDPVHHDDLTRWAPDNPHGYGLPPAGFVPITASGGISYSVRFSEPLHLSGTFGFELFSAPEAALRRSDALLGLLGLARAGDRVDVEQMYEHLSWGTLPDGRAAPNVRLEAYIEAARRGARVRILLNGGSFGQTGVDLSRNIETVGYLNALARRERLDLRARLGDPTGYGIHSKMVLVRLGSEEYVHLGSLNGSEVSSKANREIVLQVRSAEAHAYLQRLFEDDWTRSGRIFLPAVYRGYRGPSDHLLVSEVLYDPSGSEPGEEWVELYNPTAQSVDLSGWSLGDAAVDGEYGSGRYLFPEGTRIGPRAVVVVAAQAADAIGFQPDLEFCIDPHRDDPRVPNMVPAGAWAGFGFALSNSGDEFVLRDALGRSVDVLVYGGGSYPGIVPHLGGVAPNHSLERRPPDRDSDDCAHDFWDRYPPTPGRVVLQSRAHVAHRSWRGEPPRAGRVLNTRL
ncbi:MAG: lamin tail domain-containing protein [Chloroflexia bacterium]